MRDLLAALAFALFVLAAVSVARARTPQVERDRTRRLILVSLGLSFAAGFLQLDLYPFSAWPLVAGTVPDTISAPRLMAIDDRGVEHAIDARAFRPIPPDELWSWLPSSFESLTASAQDSIASWIVAHADTVRSRAARGAGVPGFGVLGPLGAPFFLLHPRPWDEAGRVPARPFVGLVLYRESWRLGSRQAGGKLQRDVRFRWPRERR